MIIIGGLTGFSLTVLALTTGLLKPTIKLVALSSLGIIPISIIVSENIHRQANRKVRELENSLSEAKAKLKQLETVQEDNGRLSQSLIELRDKLSQVQTSLSLLSVEYKKLQTSYQIQGAQNEELKTKTQNLSAQLASYEETYSDELESELKQRIEEYTTKDREALKAKYRAILEEGEVIYQEALEVSEKYKAWAHEVAKRHQDRKAYIMGLTGEFNKRIGEAENAIEVERGHLITQVEALNEKVARLQQQLAGDLTEPEYGQFGYAIEGKIANDIARWCWDNLQIPLAIKDFQKRSDGVVDVGYGYGRSASVEALIRDLQGYSENIAKSLGLYKITSVRKLEIADLLVLSFRREPAIKQDELKRLLTPTNQLAKTVLKGMAQKPTLRVMGATGSGKGICVKYLLSIISGYIECYIRLHDPQHGSSEDHWDIPKVSKSGAETKKALSKISQQMRDREVTKINQPITVDILDEIDTQLEKSDKEQFLDLISRIRHLGMKLILIGQNPKVNRAGFQWSDMGQMIAFYQKESALDAIKNYPALKLKEDILTKQYYQLSEAYELKNKDLDTHKQYYFGFCVIPGKTPVWYELPVADSIAINEEMAVIGESLEVTVGNSVNVEGQNSAKAQPSVMADSSQEAKSAKAETLAQQKMAAFFARGSVIPHVGGSAESRHGAKTICKKHPGVELSQGKDGRYYCKGCQKKLRKDELTVEI